MRTTAACIREDLNYDPLTGVFVWARGRHAGRVAGCIAKDGYRIIRYCKSNVYAHRLAWLHVYGEMPPLQIDHRDGNRDNNAIANLRTATAAENAQNRVAYRTNKSGYQGVSKIGNRYLAQIKSGQNHIQLGYTDDPVEAHKLYLAAKTQLHRFQPEPRAV